MNASGVVIENNRTLPYPPRLDPKDFPVFSVFPSLQESLLHWPWNLLVVTLLIVMIWALRFRKKTLPLAFALGGFMGTLVSRIIR